MARLFDGVNDYAAVDLVLSDTAVITIAFWMWWDSYADDDQLAMEYTTNFNNQRAFIVDPNSGAIPGQFEVSMSTSGFYHAEKFTRPSAATWHHYVMVLDRATPNIEVYVDGTTVSSTVDQTHSLTGNFNDDTLYFMSRSGSSLFGDGRLAEFALWKEALTADHASALGKGFSPLLVRPQNLYAYMPMHGQSSPDRELRNNKATSTSGAVFTDHPKVFRPSAPRAVPYVVAGAGSALTASFSDTITLSDVAAKAMGLVKSDTETLSDVAAKVYGKAGADSLTLNDAAAKGVGKPAADSTTLSDASIKGVGKAPADTASLSDSPAKSVGKPQADTATLTDAPSKGVGKPAADSTTLSDAAAKGIGKNPADSETLSDASTKAVGKTAADTANLQDEVSSPSFGEATGNERTKRGVGK